MTSGGKIEKNADTKIMMGIETSCDETAVAVVRQNKGGDGEVLSNLVLSQLKEHAAFGGVVPEIAARAHLDHIDTLIQGALDDAKITFKDLDGIAATSGPGLIGGVMVGMMAGKAIAAAQDIPFIGVNHLEAHALTARLTNKVDFPFLVLLVSGGHTQILIAEDVGVYKRWGTTIDDALGECFDKSAKLMGLPYPGGPNLEKMAATCDDHAAALKKFPLPQPLTNREGSDFSFSGLKTAVRTHVDKLPEGDLDRGDIAALCYSFQITVGKVLQNRCHNAIERFLSTYETKEKKPTFVVCGGVAANFHIREVLQDLTSAHDMDFIAPPLGLCSDNGAMIAWTGLEKLNRGQIDSLDIAARPRWPLDLTAEARPGGGVKA